MTVPGQTHSPRITEWLCNSRLVCQLVKTHRI